MQPLRRGSAASQQRQFSLVLSFVGKRKNTSREDAVHPSASHLLLKPVDLGDLANHGHDIAVLKGIVSGELNIGLAGMLHRDDIDADYGSLDAGRYGNVVLVDDKLDILKVVRHGEVIG